MRGHQLKSKQVFYEVPYEKPPGRRKITDEGLFVGGVSSYMAPWQRSHYSPASSGGYPSKSYHNIDLKIGYEDPHHTQLVQTHTMMLMEDQATIEEEEVHAESMEAEKVEAADAVRAGGEARRVNFTIPGTSDRFFSAEIVPFEDPTAEGATILMALYDLTAHRRTERMRSDFIANASHELRTPLASLIGFIDTLQGPAREDPAARERFLGNAPLAIFFHLCREGEPKE